jgi:hypothetical protein
MSGTENLWEIVFQDKPIPEARLASLRENVLCQIGEHPQDFQGLLVGRKRWVLLLTAIFILGGLLSVLLVLINGYIFAGFLNNAAFQIVLLVTELTPVFALLWDNYSFYLLSVLVLLLVLYRSESSAIDGRRAN